MDIRFLQQEVNRRWSDQVGNPCHLSDPTHALVHLTKALGKVAAAINDAEHEGRAVSPEVGKYLADLVICTARVAPNVDLATACADRLLEKFPS